MMDIREKTSLLHSAAENTGYIKKAKGRDVLI